MFVTDTQEQEWAGAEGERVLRKEETWAYCKLRQSSQGMEIEREDRSLPVVCYTRGRRIGIV